LAGRHAARARRSASIARQGARPAPQLSARCELGAVRATLLCRFAYDLAHFGSELAALLPPGRSRAAGDPPAQPDQQLPANDHPTIEVGAQDMQHCLLQCESCGRHWMRTGCQDRCSGPCLMDRCYIPCLRMSAMLC